MKARMFWAVVLGLSLLVVLVGLGQAQEPELTQAPEVQEEVAVQPAATVTAEWRQRLGQDGLDNYRVQRRPSSTGSWVTLLTLTMSAM